MSDTAQGAEEQSQEIPGMFEGPMMPLIIRMALPMLMGMLVQLVYNMTDTYFISRIDPSDPSIVGGTGLIFPLAFFAMAISNGLMGGTSSLVARSVGARDKETLSRSADSALVLSIIFGVALFLPLYFFAGPLVRRMGASGDFFTNGYDYLSVIRFYLIPMMIGQTLSGVLQGEGRMKYVMTSMMIGTFGNIILDPIFIFDKGEFLIGYFGMGVKGAAMATLIAQSLSVVYIIGVFIRQKSSVEVSWNPKYVRGKIMAEILRVGMPQAFNMIMLSLSFVFVNNIVISEDPLAMTAFSLAGRVDNALFMPLFAISAALVTIVGQNSARGNMLRARKAWRRGILAGLSVTFIAATVLVLLARFIYPIFSDVPQVVDYAVRQTYILEYSILFLVMNILGIGVFQAMGKPLPGLLLVFARLYVITLPLVLLFVKGLGMGIPGVWFGFLAGNVLSGVLGIFWTEFHWKRQIQSSEMPSSTAQDVEL